MENLETQTIANTQTIVEALNKWAKKEDAMTDYSVLDGPY